MFEIYHYALSLISIKSSTPFHSTLNNIGCNISLLAKHDYFHFPPNNSWQI